jgi:hypothetical protein
MIEIKIGEKLLYEDDRVGKLVDMKLTPNGFTDRSLVAILYVEMDGRHGKSIMSATSNRFKPANETYEELYPTVHLMKLTDKLEADGIR